MADAAPDEICTMEQASDTRPHIEAALTAESQVTENASDKENTASVVVPETRVSRVDTLPVEDKKRMLHKRNPSDAQPDHVEDVTETGGRLTNSGSPSSPSRTNSTAESRTTIEYLVGEGEEAKAVAAPEPTGQMQNDFDSFNDEFDEFEAGDVNAASNDDFGDFDDFETTNDVADAAAGLDAQLTATEQTTPGSSLFPIIDFDDFNSLNDLLDDSKSYLDTLFSSSQNRESLPPIPPIQDAFAIFITDRSRSLWSQLIAPPPLQPPNWVRSRIRRLFLISLGVPVDLDQILPAKKQKKLVLYSTQEPSSTWSGNRQRGKGTPGASSTSTPVASRPGSGSGNGTSMTNASSRRRGPPPPPDLDFTAVRQLYSMTDEALDGLTDSELREHISDLEDVTMAASKVLEYWLQRKDRQIGEKEAFEGVIENLVKHARQVRK
ncbi:hypothetical protein KEM54_003252 [Ascosphaera aggregata]|nr:hypothetical protein KEM54_003252 [Ascosphaera aggregata]